MVSQTCPDGTSGAGACCSDRSCTVRLRTNASVVYGRLELVVQVAQGTVTKNRANALGRAGFEVPIVVDVPRFEGA